MNNFVAILPAAGNSSRYSGEIPKQFLTIDGRTILELSIRPLLDFSECLGVCVLVPPEDQYHKALEIRDNPKIFLAEGGTSRIDSVAKGVKFWQQSELSYDYILIHDAARPNFSIRLINKIRHTIKGVCKEFFMFLIIFCKTFQFKFISENNFICCRLKFIKG